MDCYERARAPVDRAKLHQMLDELLELRERSNPQSCADPETIQFRGASVGKDDAAHTAVFLAAVIMLETASWAINHRAGRALANASPRPIDRDLHTNEVNGAEYLSQHGYVEPAQAKAGRAVFRSFLEPFWLSFPGGMWSGLDHALEALDFGEAQAILRPEKSRNHGPAYTLRYYRLLAAELAYYLNGLGINLGEAQRQVSTAFGVSSETLRSWEKTLLPKSVDVAELKGKLNLARRAGQSTAALRQPSSVRGNEPEEFEVWSRRAYFSIQIEDLHSLGAQYQGWLREEG